MIESPVIVETPARTKLVDALEKYTDYIQYHRSLRTFRTYRPILKSFGEFCTRTYVDEIDRATTMEFATHCLKQGQNGKTIYNKLVVICQLLKQHGRTKILNASDWPSFVQTVRPIYEDGELAKLGASHRGHAFDRAVESLVQRVHGDANLLPGVHPGQLRFFKVGGHPQIVDLNYHHQLLGRRDTSAYLCAALRDHA